MLKEITLRNFKSFGGEHKIPLSRINLIYGANSAGKSSIIQALLLLKQSHTDGDISTTSRGLITRGSLTDLGSFETLVHRHESRRGLGVGVLFDRVNLGLPQPRNAELYIDMSFGSASTGKAFPQLTEVQYEISPDSNKRSFDFGLARTSDSDTFIWDTGGSSSSYAQYLINHTDIFNAFDSSDTRRLSRSLRSSVFKASHSILPIQIERGEDFQRLIDEHRLLNVRSNASYYQQDPSLPLKNMANYLGHNLRSIRYLGPMRSQPERIYEISGGSRASVGSRGEHTQHILFYIRGSVDATNKAFQDSKSLTSSTLLPLEAR